MEKVGQRITRALKVSSAVVEVEAVPQRLTLPKLIAAAHDVEIEIIVAVGIEEGRGDVLMQAVGAERGLGRRAQGPGGGLNEKRTWLPFGAADIDVGPAILVDIADGESGAFGGQQVRHQRLATEVEERVFVMLKEGTQLRADIGEQGLYGLWCIRPATGCFSL